MADKDREDEEKAHGDEHGEDAHEDAAPPEPETKKAEPETKKAEPETKKAEPETKKAEPETKKAEPETKKAEPETKKAEPAKKAAPPPKDDDDEESPSEGADHDDDDDEDEDAEPAPKPAEKPAAKPAAKPGAKPVRRKAPPPKGGSVVKSLILFAAILGLLVLAFKLLGGGEEPGAGAVVAPKWNVGQTVDVEVTVVPSDNKDLACASPQTIDGKHCQFEAQNKAFATQPDDKHMLKPYTTTDRVQFTAAGLWSDPGMAPAKMPPVRFSVKCKYKVEGKLSKPAVRWSETGQWFPNGSEWYAGSLSACHIVSPG